MGRNKAPSENTVRILCGKSAGMCEFEGCNKRLFYDNVTLKEFNNAFVAHIIASSTNGPRGDKVLSPKLSDKPYKYHEWFEERMKTQVTEIRKDFATKNNVEIDQVPLYQIKTPLQRTVQLLKRHRDVMYDKLPQNRKDNAPISIIITTLAALAYNNEANIFDALNNIVAKMENYIEKDGETYKILNPVMSEENFADKWNTEPAKAQEFFCWLQCVRNEMLVEPLEAQGCIF